MLVYTIAVEAATTIDKAPNAHHAAQTSCSGKVFLALVRFDFHGVGGGRKHVLGEDGGVQ